MTDESSNTNAEEQLFPTDTCHFCYASEHAYKFMPCQHLAGCAQCVGQLVTKTFTRETKSHRCMFCSQKVTKFMHLESNTMISPRELQGQYPNEMAAETFQREEEYEAWVAEITNSRDNEEALGIYDEQEDEEEDLDDDDDEEEEDQQIFNIIRRVVGRNVRVRATQHNLVDFINHLRRAASQSASSDRAFIFEMNAEAIEGELDYVPSSESENEEDEKVVEDTPLPTHPMLTRGQAEARVEEKDNEADADAVVHVPVVNRRRRRATEEEEEDDEARPPRYNLRRRYH